MALMEPVSVSRQMPRKATPEAGGNRIGAAKSKAVAPSLGDGAMLAAGQSKRLLQEHHLPVL